MRRGVRRALLTAGGTAIGLAAAVAAERYLVRRARARPDPDRGVPLAERPGEATRIRSFDGTELQVNVVGPPNAPALLFVHGFTLDLTVWHFQWKRFSKRYRCILFDQRGHGRSGEAGDGGYTVQALGKDVKAVLDAAAPTGPVALLGHSMGGMAIMALAEEHPEEFGSRVGAVALADTSAADLIREFLSGLGTRLSAFVAQNARRAVRSGAASRFRARALARRSGLAFLVAEATNFGPHASPSLIDYVVEVASQARPEVWTHLMHGMLEMDLTHALQHITVPALIVVGDVDRLTPQASAMAMAGLIPDPRVVVLKGAGHCSMLERHEQFNAVVGRFLKETFPAQARGPDSEDATVARGGP